MTKPASRAKKVTDKISIMEAGDGFVILRGLEEVGTIEETRTARIIARALKIEVPK